MSIGCWAGSAGSCPEPVSQVQSGTPALVPALRLQGRAVCEGTQVTSGVVQGAEGVVEVMTEFVDHRSRNGSFCLLTCKEEEVSTKGRELPPGGAEELPG